MYCTQCGKEYNNSTKLVQETTQQHKCMTKKQYLGFIILVLMIFGVLFYWFALRPSSIKKGCNYWAAGRAQGYVNEYDLLYKQCLREEGL